MIISLSICFLKAEKADACTALIITECGYATYCPGPSYFGNSWSDWQEWMQFLNEVHCGGPGIVEYHCNGNVEFIFP